jgi:hypothetical protein
MEGARRKNPAERRPRFFCAPPLILSIPFFSSREFFFGRKHCMIRKISASLLLLAIASTARATLLVEEQFNYGAPGGTIQTLNGGTGFNAGWATPAAMSNIPYGAGLTFGSLAVAGGAASTPDPAAPYANARGFSAATTTTLDNVGGSSGTWYGSFLANYIGGIPNVPTFLAIGEPDNINGPNPVFETHNAAAPNNNAAFKMETRVASTGLPLTAGVTYMYLWQIKFSAHAHGDLWILTADQYDNFVTGGLTETELNTAALGAGATDVYDRIQINANQFPTELDQIYLYAPLNQVTFDEIRISINSLTEAAPQAVPEPASLSILALGALALLRRKRS